MSKRETDVFVDFKGWRFRAPFRCMCCGVEVSVRQFCFGRYCGLCDVGHCEHPNAHHALGGSYSGPRELIDPQAENFIRLERWLNPASGLSGKSEKAVYRRLKVPDWTREKPKKKFDRDKPREVRG